MNELTNYDQMPLLERAEKLNKLSEVSQVALGMCLVKIKEDELFKSLGYDEWHDYYQKELGRSKGDVSKLLTVGQFMLSGGFPQETDVGYTLLYASIKNFPEKEPDYVLSAAQTNTLAELADGGRDEKYGDHTADWELAYHCKTCGKYTTKKENHA